MQGLPKNAEKFDEIFLKYLGLSGAKACKSCRSRQELSNENLLAKIGVDTAENEPLKVHLIFKLWDLIFKLWDLIFTEPPRPAAPERWAASVLAAVGGPFPGRRGPPTPAMNPERCATRRDDIFVNICDLFCQIRRFS